SLPCNLPRAARGKEGCALNARREAGRVFEIGVLLIPTAPEGLFRLLFAPAYAGRRVSAAAILRGDPAPNSFANQIAIVGVTAIGITYAPATPIDPRRDRVCIRAHGRDNNRHGRRVTRARERR